MVLILSVVAQAPLRFDQQTGAERTSTGALRQQEFLRRIHYPLNQPSGLEQLRWQAARKALSANSTTARSGESYPWQPDGPNGVKVAGEEVFFSGRIRDVEILGSGIVRIGAASGGLWERQPDDSWLPISDSVTSQAIGAFTTNPVDENIILLGTGESSQRSGTGVWRTQNRGTSWQHIPLEPEVSTCLTIRFNPQDTSIVHLAATEGYYRSVDGGRSFSRILEGEYDDVQVDPVNPERIFLSRRYFGLLRSHSGGDTLSWSYLTGGWDSALFGRGVLAICPLDPDVVYFNLIRSDNWRTEGVYKSLDGGDSWARCLVQDPDLSEVSDFHWGQGWYNTLISVRPNDCDQVWVGGGSLWRTLDGFTFREINPLHPDQHRMTWKPDGTEAWLANDGGIFYSEDGWIWNGRAAYNALPIRQYTSFSIGVTDKRTMAGGSQDNGIAVRPSWWNDWLFTIGGDGGTVAISRFDHTRIFATNGVYGGDLSFRNLESNSEGNSWNDVNNGISACGQWWLNVRDNDEGGVYTHCGGKVYYRDFFEDTWTHINAGPPFFFNTDIWNLNVGAGTPENVYACMPTWASRRLIVLDRSTGTWVDRSSGLPGDTYVREISPDPVHPDKAYALMGGIPPSGDLGRKIYRTEDAGRNWINITGNLPNVPLTDLLIQPADSAKLYVCGDVGCFSTENGGESWQDWSEGLPANILFSEMGLADSLAINGRLWIFGATYGRAIWKRMIQEEPPVVSYTGTAANSQTLRIRPNPASDIVQVVIPDNSAEAGLFLYNSQGHQILSRTIPAGLKEWSFTLPVDLPSGIYHLEFRAKGNSTSGRLMISR